MSDQDDVERRMADDDYEATDDDYEAIESLAWEAFEAGEFVRYRELLQRNNNWPPPMGSSAAEVLGFVDGDFAEMDTMLERNGKRGSLLALQILISEAYKAGEVEVAREWFRRTAQFGDSQMLVILARIANEATDLYGERWCCEAAAELGDPEAMFYLGALVHESGDLAAAEAWYCKAAELGDADAMFTLGKMSENADDMEGARTWYEQAGNLGSGDAMSSLGLILRGVEGDNARSLAWLERGASIGHAGAILFRYLAYPERQIDFALQLRDQVAASLELDDIGGVLVEGLCAGVPAYPEDALFFMSPSLVECGDKEAAKRHRMVAQRRYEARADVGDAEAMLNLGQLLIQDGEDRTGRGWIEKSASLGDEGAVKALADLDDGTAG